MLLHSSKVHKTKYKLCSTIYLSFFVVLKKVFLERCTYTNTHFNLLPLKKSWMCISALCFVYVPHQSSTSHFL